MTTLPTPLVRFRAELETAIARDLRPRRRRRLALRVAAASAAAAAIAAGALTALPGDPDGRLVQPASAAERAAAALAATPGSVVHVVSRVEQRSPDGSTTSWRTESWQRTSPPYDVREIVTGEDGRPVESSAPQPVTAEPLREQVRGLLRDGKLTRVGGAAGETVSFAWTDAGTRYEYTVESGTFEPVRWRFSSAAGSETTVTFETYEVLAADDAAGAP